MPALLAGAGVGLLMALHQGFHKRVVEQVFVVAQQRGTAPAASNQRHLHPAVSTPIERGDGKNDRGGTKGRQLTRRRRGRLLEEEMKMAHAHAHGRQLRGLPMPGRSGSVARAYAVSRWAQERPLGWGWQRPQMVTPNQWSPAKGRLHVMHIIMTLAWA
jgi:hypothetical protein